MTTPTDARAALDDAAARGLVPMPTYRALAAALAPEEHLTCWRHSDRPAHTFDAQHRPVCGECSLPLMTSQVLRINLPRALVRPLLADIDAWRAGRPFIFSGVLQGHYARLYISVDGAIPPALYQLCLRYLDGASGTMAPVGAWLMRSEAALLDEAALWRAVAP